jgi:hypothetical protein
MKYLKQKTVVKYEQLLIKHLSLGGNVRDLTGKNLVGQQVLTLWNESGIGDICAAHSITMEDFCQIYAACIEQLMPNPCINSGGTVPMLEPTLFLLEEWRIRELFSLIAKETVGSQPEKRIEDYKEGMVEAARLLQNLHDAARGPVEFIIRPGKGLPVSAADPANRLRGCGCTSIILVCLALVSMSLIVVIRSLNNHP